MALLSNQAWSQIKARGPAVMLFLLGLLCLNFGVHVFTPFDQRYETRMVGLNRQPSRHLPVYASRHLSTLDPKNTLNPSKDPSAKAAVPNKEQQQQQQQAPPAAASGSERHFLVGYGSLINAKSRAKTSQTGSAIPVLIKGYKRGWYYAQPERKMTALGVVPDPEASVNGVMVRVKKADLPKFDSREKRYTRKLVPAGSVSLHPVSKAPPGFSLNPADKIWIYVVDTKTPPSPALPVAQSYVDVFVGGCLQYGRKFADECVWDTKRWADKQTPNKKGVWINDRQMPRIYQKGFVGVDKQGIVDQVLQNQLKAQFGVRKDINPEQEKLEQQALKLNKQQQQGGEGKGKKKKK